MAVSAITARRLARWRANRRGYYSWYLFIAVFVLSLGADWLANDRPWLIHYQQQWYVPVLVDYPESEFGGFLPYTDYRDPVLIENIEAGGGQMWWPPIRFRYDTVDQQLDRPNPAPPSAEHWLGTDDQGRDVLARLLYGLRSSIIFGLLLTLSSSLLGVAVGALQGYFGGWVDLLGQRFLEIWSGLPQLFILIIVSSIIVPGFWTLLAVLLLFSWTGLVGIVRAEFLRTRNFDYVRAAKALGLSDTQVIVRHVLPNALVATLTFLPFILSSSVVALTALDFLGLGLPPGEASLGELLKQGKDNLQAPWLGLSGFFVLALLLSLLVFIGEAVRDAFDPRRA